MDTWGWVALADGREPRHQVVASIYAERSRIAGRIITSNFVLDEFFTQYFARRPFNEASPFCSSLLFSPNITVEFVDHERFQTAFNFRLKLADKPRISFTDLTSMVIMRELGIADVMTGDKHFQQVNLGFRMLPE
jgi:uncharacterized protein